MPDSPHHVNFSLIMSERYPCDTHERVHQGAIRDAHTLQRHINAITTIAVAHTVAAAITLYVMLQRPQRHPGIL